MATAATPATKPKLEKVLIRRTAISLVLVVIMLLPTVILFVITKQPSATYASMGALIGIVAVAAGGLRIGVITSVVVGLIAPLTIIAGLSPITGAALMALMTLTVGRLATFGLHRAVVLVPIMLVWPMLTPVPWIPSGLETEVQQKLTAEGMTVTEAVAQAQSGSATGSSSSAMTEKITDALIKQRMDTTYLSWIVVFFFIGTIVAVGCTWLLLRKRERPVLAPHPRSETVPYTIAITILASAATWYCLDNPKLVAGSFLVATILVLMQIGNDVAWKLTIQRVLGTVGGVLLLTGILEATGTLTYSDILGVPIPVRLYIIGIVFGALAIIAKFSPRQWIYYIFIVPTAAMLNAFTTTQATDFGKQRLADNLAGAALVLIATAITLAGSRLMAKRHQHDEGADIAENSLV